jgi:hypothetical protein
MRDDHIEGTQGVQPLLVEPGPLGSIARVAMGSAGGRAVLLFLLDATVWTHVI